MLKKIFDNLDVPDGEKEDLYVTEKILMEAFLNQYVENLVDEKEIQGEIQKQLRSMPGQEKMVLDYYKNNQSAVASLRGALYEE